MKPLAPTRRAAAFVAWAALAVLAPGGAARADVVIIVSVKNPTLALSAAQAADIFLGKYTFFPGGGKAVPIDQDEGAAPRDAFYKLSCGKARPQMLAHWARMIFTGRGQPPVESGDGAEIRRQVAGNPELIGYIDKSMVDASVRVVLTLR